MMSAYRSGWEFQVHGVHASHLAAWLEQKQFSLESDFLTLERRSGKIYNCKRPVMAICKTAEGKRILATFVFPSPQYLDQYASLIAQFIDPNNDLQSLVACYFYPEAFYNFPEWSGLETGLSTFLVGGETVVIGAVEAVSASALAHGFIETQEPISFGNGFGIRVLEDVNHRERLAFLGMQDSFWGNTAGVISKTLADKNIARILYVSKAGTFAHPAAVHGLLCPCTFHLYETSLASYSVKSGFREHLGDDLVVSNHISVPTVMGETFAQMKNYSHLRPATIDNESAYIAKAVSDFNVQKSSSLEYAALHFITDYLPLRIGQKSSLFDLTHVMDKIVHERKAAVFDLCGQLITSYLRDKNAPVFINSTTQELGLYLLSIEPLNGVISTVSYARLSNVYEDIGKHWLEASRTEEKLVEVDCSKVNSFAALLATIYSALGLSADFLNIDDFALADVSESVEFTLLLKCPEHLFKSSELERNQLESGLRRLLLGFLTPQSKATILIQSFENSSSVKAMCGLSDLTLRPRSTWISETKN
jgi:hypothetical protein